MNLRAGLMALDGYNKSADAQQQRDRATQRFDWEKQRAQSELSILPDKTSAARAGYQNQAGAAQADMEMRPGEVANKKKAQAQAGYGLDRAAARQAQDEDTKDFTSGVMNNEARVKSKLTDAAVEDLPRLIAEQKQKGILDGVEAQQAAVTGLARLIDMGDNAAVVKYMNDMDAVAPDPSQRLKAPVARVGHIQNPNDPNDQLFVALDANGNPLRQVSMAKLRSMVSPSKSQVLKPGETIGQVDSRGQFTPSYTAPETRAGKLSNMGPLERDVTYLMEAHGKSKEQALDYLHSAKSMSRDQFVLNGLQDMKAFGNLPTDADISDLGALYDKATGQQQGAGPAPQQSPIPASAAPARTIYDLTKTPPPGNVK